MGRKKEAVNDIITEIINLKTKSYTKKNSRENEITQLFPSCKMKN